MTDTHDSPVHGDVDVAEAARFLDAGIRYLTCDAALAESLGIDPHDSALLMLEQARDRLGEIAP